MLKDGDGDKPVQADKDFEEYQKVMQPRTVKGPSWKNEQQPQPQPLGKAMGVSVKGNQMDADPTPSQNGLSDMEWMRQRMAKPTVEDPDIDTHHVDPSTNQVRPC